jgi:hypothetical protein
MIQMLAYAIMMMLASDWSPLLTVLLFRVNVGFALLLALLLLRWGFCKLKCHMKQQQEDHRLRLLLAQAWQGMLAAVTSSCLFLY